MHSRCHRYLAPLALLAATLTSCVAVAAPSFTLIGFPTPTVGDGASRLLALSADGRSAAGYTVGTGGSPGTYWTADGGRNDFGRGLGLPQSFSFGISGDGHTVVGGADTGSIYRAFRWTQAGGYHDLGTLSGYSSSEARDASHDGSVIVGWLGNAQGSTPQAFRWTQAGGMQGLGAGTRALAISGDGSMIVGLLGTAPAAFSWTQASGLQVLTPLGGSGNASAAGINWDGSIIVGESGPDLRATMWVNGNPIDLSGGSMTQDLSPNAVNDNGSIVAGQLNRGIGGRFAGVWTQETGMMKLSDYLVANGVLLPAGINLATCSAISSDGLTFAGYTADGPLGVQGFIATILPPCPADLDNDGLFSNGPTPDLAVTIDDLLYFLVGFEAGSAAVDLDNGSNTGTPDNAVTIDDLLYLLTHFEAGC